MTSPFRIPLTEDPRFATGAPSSAAAYSFYPTPNALLRDYALGDADIIRGYVIEKHEQKAEPAELRRVRRNLGMVLEAQSSRSLPPTYRDSDAVAYCLGAERFALEHIVAHSVLRLRVVSAARGTTWSWDKLAKAHNLKRRSMMSLVAHPDFKARLAAMTEGLVEGERFNGVPFPGDEWLDPRGEGGWQAKVLHVSRDIAARAEEGRKAKHLPADLRRAAYVLVLWHAHYGRVLPPEAITALAAVMGFYNSDPDRGHFPAADESKVEIAAKLDALATKRFGELISVNRVAKEAGVSRPTLRRWRDSDARYREMLAEYLADPNFK